MQYSSKYILIITNIIGSTNTKVKAAQSAFSNFVDGKRGTFYYFLINSYYYLCVSQTIYVILAFPEKIKKYPYWKGYSGSICRNTGGY